MEGIAMSETLNQDNQNNTVDGGIHLESGRDVQRSLSPTITKFKSLMKGEEVSRGSPTSSYGSLSLCGRRRKMEDTLTISPRFILSDQEGEDLMVLDFFAVYDGHAGASAADLCKEKLHFLLVEEIQEALKGHKVDWNKVFGNCFVKLDNEVDEDMRSIGCTALVALVSSNEIIVANCGESRAVLCRQGEVVYLSPDHMLERPDELERVEAAGGRVLATSQSVGDQHAISVPEVSITTRSKNDEFIILATDGLWDVMTEEMACYVVRKCLQGEHVSSLSSSDEENGASEAAALLVELAMAKESQNNISVVVIELNKVLNKV